MIAEFIYDGPALLDLDDAGTLLELGVRPSQIVVQNLDATQTLARRIFESRDGERTQGGLVWWSSQLPSENSVLLWGQDGVPPSGLKLVGIQPLTVSHPAVVEAAARLYRELG